MNAPKIIDWQPLFEKIGAEISDLNLLKEALTHTSIMRTSQDKSYERLEFLGDRVLGLIIADTLFHHYPEEEEGKLAKRHAYLVKKSTLVSVALQIGLEQYIVMAPGEEKAGGQMKSSLLADSCEALIAALYLDQGLRVANEFILRYWMPLIENMQEVPQDAKSRLQEWAQGQGYATPYYELVSRTGPDHAPEFTLKAIVENYGECLGVGDSKRSAQQDAAKKLLEKVQYEDK